MLSFAVQCHWNRLPTSNRYFVCVYVLLNSCYCGHPIQFNFDSMHVHCYNMYEQIIHFVHLFFHFQSCRFVLVINGFVPAFRSFLLSVVFLFRYVLCFLLSSHLLIIIHLFRSTFFSSICFLADFFIFSFVLYIFRLFECLLLLSQYLLYVGRRIICFTCMLIINLTSRQRIIRHICFWPFIG